MALIHDAEILFEAMKGYPRHETSPVNIAWDDLVACSILVLRSEAKRRVKCSPNPAHSVVWVDLDNLLLQAQELT